MIIIPGALYTIKRDGEAIGVQTLYSPDAGKSWYCSREDSSPAETAMLVSSPELMRDSSGGE